MVEGLDNTFLVANGDVLTTLKLCDLIQFHKQQKAIATIAVHLRHVKIDFGVIEWGNAPQIGQVYRKTNH